MFMYQIELFTVL